MERKSKFDYEIENFKSIFWEKKDKKIVLYGIGRMTATLVNGIKGFHIIGLCDRDSGLVGTRMYGLPVLDRNDVEKKADMVVINTSATYWETIYQRIKEWKVPIYYLNGKLAEDHVDEIVEDSYWNKNADELRKLIGQYEVVSFDIFDTLVMRTVMFPIDVFRIVEMRLDSRNEIKTHFMAMRKKAASMLENPTLDEIYRKMKELTQKTDEEMERWKKLEIQTEKNILMAREDMVDICKEVMKDKQVFLISDMYYPQEILQRLLEGIGLCVERGQIIVSCEQKKTKEDGGLWRYYKENIVCGRKAIHIGDNEKTDIQNVEEYGIRAYHVWSAYEMLQKSSIKSIVSTIESLYSSIAMGLICSRLFNSPFALNSTQGKIKFKDEKEAGYCLLGSLLYSFMEWLIDRSIQDGIGQLIFFAREGYLLIPIYNFFKEIKEGEHLPEAVYLEISRRAIWNASISSEEDIDEIAGFPYMGTFRMFLWERFGVNVTEKELSGISLDEISGDFGRIKEILYPFKEKIFERSKKEKENYQAYMDDLDLGDKYAVVDSQFYGSTQYYLGKMLNKKLTGYYFCACLEEDNIYLCGNKMCGCFQGSTKMKAKDTNVHKQAQFLESFFTSPEGMLEYIDAKGRKKYAEKMLNQKNFSIRIEMTEGIKEFIEKMFFWQKGLNIEQHDNMWSDTLFGCLMDGGFIPSERMEKSFYFDNNITGGREVPIWERG